jgi:hypothetical protein
LITSALRCPTTPSQDAESPSHLPHSIHLLFNHSEHRRSYRSELIGAGKCCQTLSCHSCVTEVHSFQRDQTLSFSLSRGSYRPCSSLALAHLVTPHSSILPQLHLLTSHFSPSHFKLLSQCRGRSPTLRTIAFSHLFPSSFHLLSLLWE